MEWKGEKIKGCRLVKGGGFQNGLQAEPSLLPTPHAPHIKGTKNRNGASPHGLGQVKAQKRGRGSNIFNSVRGGRKQFSNSNPPTNTEGPTAKKNVGLNPNQSLFILKHRTEKKIQNYQSRGRGGGGEQPGQRKKETRTNLKAGTEPHSSGPRRRVEINCFRG